MDIYTLLSNIANWVGWPILTILLLLGGGYIIWVLNQRIEGLKEINNWLEARAKDAENYSPSALVERLATRHKVLTEEIEKIYNESKSEKQRVDVLEAEKSKISTELNKIAAQLHIFRNVEVNELAGFFANWYSKEGVLSVFCSDLDWLAGDSHKKVVDALLSKGNKLNLYLRQTNHPIAKKLVSNGANLYHIKPTIRSEHRFSTLANGDVKSIIIRNKNVEKTEITFEEYQDQPGLVNLAQDLLDNCYDKKVTNRNSIK